MNDVPKQHNWSGKSVRFDREYDDDSPLYGLPGLGRWVRRNLHRRRDLVLSLLGDVEGKHVIDVGCGVGRISHELARRGAHVTGFDVSPDAIEYATELATREGLDCDFRVADVASADFPPADAWIAVGLLQYLPEPEQLFERLADVPTFVCDVERRDHWIHPLRRLYRHYLNGNPFRAWVEGELPALFARYGSDFQVDQGNPTGFLVWRRDAGT